MLQQATFANGCFWCTEAVFQRLKGVENVRSGYTGGMIKNPSYREVCMGRTGHAEGIQFDFDPEQISYLELLQIFFKTHDPTTLNRQGNDVGTQYRSHIFTHNEEQQEQATQIIEELNREGVFDAPIVTKVSAASEFYVAESKHQDFYNQNEYQPYCQYIIVPKLSKLEAIFADKLK